jgi:hypothetical protein
MNTYAGQSLPGVAGLNTLIVKVSNDVLWGFLQVCSTNGLITFRPYQ